MLPEHISSEPGSTASNEPPDSPFIPPGTERPPAHPDTLLGAAVGLGILMVAAAAVWNALSPRVELKATLHWSDIWHIVPGFLIGGIFAWIVWRLGRNRKATRQIVAMLSKALDLKSIRFHHVVLFSLLAGFPEEILFRGAVQPAVGIVVASVIFGALHGITRMYFAYATVAGLLLGMLFSVTGSLWAPIAAHVAVDIVMFLLLLQRDNHVIG